MFQFIFLLLEQRLNTLSELAEVDWFNNQYILSEDEEVMYKAPAAYIEFLPVDDLTTQPRKTQMGTVAFRVHVVTENYQDNDGRFKSAAMGHFDVVNQVYATLLGHAAKLSDLPDYTALAGTDADKQVYNSITRKGIQTDHNRSPLMVSIQQFSMTAYDFSAQKIFSKPANPVNPEITATLNV
jgi:hypothetical protein